MTQDLIESIKVMHLQPGDTVVLKIAQVLTSQQRDCLRSSLQEMLPEGVKTLVLERGMDIEVLRSTEAGHAATSEQAMPQ